MSLWGMRARMRDGCLDVIGACPGCGRTIEYTADPSQFAAFKAGGALLITCSSCGTSDQIRRESSSEIADGYYNFEMKCKHCGFSSSHRIDVRSINEGPEDGTTRAILRCPSCGSNAEAIFSVHRVPPKSPVGDSLAREQNTGDAEKLRDPAEAIDPFYEEFARASDRGSSPKVDRQRRGLFRRKRE
jgi:transcription elongation factor Elf1